MVFIVCKHYFIVTVHLFHLFDCLLLLLFFIIIYLFEIKTFSIQFKIQYVLCPKRIVLRISFLSFPARSMPEEVARMYSFSFLRQHN